MRTARPRWLKATLKPFFATAAVESTAPMDGGLLYFLGGYVVRLFRMYLLLGIWKSVYATRGAAGSHELQILFYYTIVASAFHQQMNVVTTASSTLWEGTVASRFLRPSGVFSQYTAETVGRWLPGLIFFTTPVLLSAKLISRSLGVGLGMAGEGVIPWFALSLALGVAVGFALDFIFAGIMIWFGEMHNAAYDVRSAVSTLLSGAFIPFYLLPPGVSRVLELLPFAGMASAPLQILTGTGDIARLIGLQFFWCVVLWPCASLMWRRNQQKLVIFGG